MPHYYIFRISQGSAKIIKQLEKIDRFNSYKDAKNKVKALRNEQPATDSALYKIIFADSELDAEQKLQEKREAPIIQEWEK